MELTKILQKVLEIGGSDLFLIPGSPATAKVKGHLVPLTESKLLPEDAAGMIQEAYGMAGGHSDEMLRRDGALHIPPMVIDLASSCRNGMVLVTGPAGSGKSTTLACMVDRINADQDVHIITIEDPIEYLHAHRRALVSQREIPNDACSFARALRAAMREAPDVIMLGEMRDYETVQTALTAAETGHLLLSSLHTVGAAKTIDRIIDTFPASQQQQVRVQLSMVLRAVVSQRLVPTVDGTQMPVFEVMAVNPAIQNMIRDGKTFQIDNVIYGGAASQAMLSMDNELIRLAKEGRITRETAQLYAVNPDMLRKRL